MLLLLVNEFVGKGTRIDLYQRPLIVILGEQIVIFAFFLVDWGKFSIFAVENREYLTNDAKAITTGYGRNLHDGGGSTAYAAENGIADPCGWYRGGAQAVVRPPRTDVGGNRSGTPFL